MIVRAALFLLMVVGLAGFGTVAWVSTRPPHEATAAPAPPVKLRVLVAARNLQAGALMRPDDLGAIDVLDRDAPKGFVVDTPETRGGLLGAMMRRSMAKGQMVLDADTMRPGDHGFLAAVLAPNMRAISVGVDAVSGTAGLIWPGDRVDLILTQNGHRGESAVSAVRVLSDARVIAIDQQLVQGITANSNATQPQAKTITLEVSNGQAERVAVAQRLGSLSLAVRSAGQAATTDAGAAAQAAQAPVWDSDITPTQPAAPQPLPPLVVHVWAGAEEGKEFHF